MSFYTNGDVRIYYEEVGSGFPLLIIPGGGNCQGSKRCCDSGPPRFAPIGKNRGRYDFGSSE